MTEHFENGIDQYVVDQLARWRVEGVGPDRPDTVAAVVADPERYLTYFAAQLQSRHLDFAARWLQSRGEGFYTIGSNGHESNAAIAMALRPDDPALLHYRSGGFFAARAAQVTGMTPIRDVLLGMVAGAQDPISGGRHKVFGHPELAIIPQTSTIGSHLPRAFGLSYAIGSRAQRRSGSVWKRDAVVVTSFGDASLNHSTVAGSLNAIDYCAHRGLDVPILIVCGDNGLGISVRSPEGWVASALSRYGSIGYVEIDGSDPYDALTSAQEAVDSVRTHRRPVAIRLRTVRFGGHAGSDAEIAYRTNGDIAADYERDPLLATARLLIVAGVRSTEEIEARYETVREEVFAEATALIGSPRLGSASEVMRPLVRRHPGKVMAAAVRAPSAEASRIPTPPEKQGLLTLAQSINAALADVLATWPEATIFGEDVARKGGVYGLTRNLLKRFGPTRVFDTILDEQTILGIALGGALDGLLPVPEIQYLAYLHNAEDQLRGEAATLAFFSNEQFHNGMVIRIPGLAYQKGFGGHFHNDNSIAVLRDIPGIVVAVPSHPADAPAMLRTCVALAAAEHRVCVFVEPIALYHTRDLNLPGDDAWTANYDPPEAWSATAIEPGDVRVHGDGSDVLVVTFGNGVPMSLRVANTLAAEGIGVSVLDLRWLAPLPTEALLAHARECDAVVVADETRRSGGVSESVVTALVDHGYTGRLRRLCSQDSFVPLGPAAESVLLNERDIVDAVRGVHADRGAS
jgi:2-oxoisovalerate dehydrogenase E1 component